MIDKKREPLRYCVRCPAGILEWEQRMATRHLIIKEDDLDQTAGEDVGTYSFCDLTGTEYEIDLSAKNVAKFAKALAPYVEVARIVKKQRKARSRGQNFFVPSDHGTTSQEIRAWARENGYQVNDRGMIPGWLGHAFLQKIPANASGRGSRRASESRES